MKKFILILMKLLKVGFAFSQNWSLKSIGGGLLVEDENYDTKETIRIDTLEFNHLQ